MFPDYIYDSMDYNDEMWIVVGNGKAVLIYDGPMMDV